MMVKKPGQILPQKKSIVHFTRWSGYHTFILQKLCMMTEMPHNLLLPILESAQAMSMLSFEYIRQYCIMNWNNIEITCVPGVMLQIRLGETKEAEFRIHWFQDCTETYIHNHRYRFQSLCIDGGYVEHSWSIANRPGHRTFTFKRTNGNKISKGHSVRGQLTQILSRQHRPGNLLEVDQCQFHSIEGDEHREAVTLVKRFKGLPAHTMILNNKTTINSPTDEIRPAMAHERKSMLAKMSSIGFKSV